VRVRPAALLAGDNVTDWNENDLPHRFFGERSEPVGTVATPQRTDGLRRETFEQRHQRRLAETPELCPVCRIDVQFPGTAEAACDGCGWSLIADRMQARTRAKEPAADYLDVYPGALRIPLEEFSPAQVDEEAA